MPCMGLFVFYGSDACTTVMGLVMPDRRKQAGGGSSDDISVVIIAVHGLSVITERMWTDPRTGGLWSRDLLPPNFRTARIFFFSWKHRIDADTVANMNGNVLQLLLSILIM